MEGPKMRASFSARGDEIRGTIALPRNGTFVLECLALIVQQLAKQTGISPGEVAADLHSLVAGKVTWNDNGKENKPDSVRPDGGATPGCS